MTKAKINNVKPLLQQANVSGWHFLPEMPEINKEVLVAVKYDNEPVQAFWTGKEWKGSFLVRDNMVDGFVRDESYKHIQEWIYAWFELPLVPPIPEPF
jgi:predicted ATP-grasp superfamily ATP-dependent carboligase